MPRFRSGFLLMALAAAPAVSSAQQADLLLLIAGADTISRERVVYGPGRLEVELLSQALGSRFRYAVTLGADGVPTRMTNAFWQPTDPDSAPPRQSVVIHFRGDSVVVEFAGGQTQRFGSRAGVMPFLNPSFALVELIVARAATIGGDSVEVPAFMVQGGQTAPFTVIRLGPDSVRVRIGGADALLRVDGANRILEGAVPSQGLRIQRTVAGTTSMRAVRPDYGAPPGAPYTAIEVQVTTPMGHILAGTLTLPAGAGPANRVAAVVTSTGSGLQDRDEALPSVPGYRLFRQLADTLSRHGIAVLRLDDRGFGGSGGNPATSTIGDHADDVRAALAWLRQRPEIDPARLGVVGHSEGGLVAPMVAATDSALQAIVLLAGPSRTGREVIRFQQGRAIDQVPGLTPVQRDSLLQVARASLDSAARQSPWIQFFLDHDPIPTARRVRHAAVLIVHGATDQQVTPDQASELETAFRAAGNPAVTTRIFPEANHLLIQDPVGIPSGYASLPERVVRPDILGFVLGWLVERMGR